MLLRRATHSRGEHGAAQTRTGSSAQAAAGEAKKAIHKNYSSRKINSTR